MTTMNELVDQVLAEVYGYTATIDPSTYLMVAVDSDDLTFSVSDARLFSRGIIQIENELILIDTVDRDNNILTAGNANCRGTRATAATSHAVGSRVTMSPSIPRQQAINAVYQTMYSVADKLFQVSSTDITYEAAISGYALPGDVETVLNVSWMPTGSANAWIGVTRWTHDKYNQMLVLGEAPQPGRTVRVHYAKEPTWPALTGEFTDAFPLSCEDVIRFGAAWRLVSFIEPQNLMSQAAEADALDRQQQPGNRIRVAQYLFQMFRQRLDEEASSLQSKFPIRTHFGG